jgi:hypothetical protein
MNPVLWPLSTDLDRSHVRDSIPSETVKTAIHYCRNLGVSEHRKYTNYCQNYNFSTYFSQIFDLMLLHSLQVSKTYNELEEDINDVNQSPSDDTTRTSVQKCLEIQQYWITLSTAIDRISCIIYFFFLSGILIKYT